SKSRRSPVLLIHGIAIRHRAVRPFTGARRTLARRDQASVLLSQQRLELLQRLLSLLLGRRLAVKAEAVFHEGDPPALLRLADDRRRPAQRAAALQRLDDRGHVVPVDLDGVPAESLELGPYVARVHDLLG